MNKKIQQNELPDISENELDYVMSLSRSVIGAVPFAGSLLIELSGAVVPGQRVERIAKFAELLNQKLNRLEEIVVRGYLSEESFVDLLEEGVTQAARSLSTERREYIAEIIANSIGSEDIEFLESKYLLDLLRQLNDIEIVWLRFFLVTAMGEDSEFREKHESILSLATASSGSSQNEFDKQALQSSYKDHLAAIGLLEKIYTLDESRRGTQLKTKSYQLTSLGRLLLREIGLRHRV